MSRLSRLRSWWRSHTRRRVTAEGYSSHRAMNLLPPPYRKTWRGSVSQWQEASERYAGQFRAPGTPPERGSWVLSASTGWKERGTRTPATAITGVSSSPSILGKAYTVSDYHRMPPYASSSIEPGSSGSGTGGVNPGPGRLGSVD